MSETLEKPLTVIGLMSGTSVDAIDACVARLWMEDGRLRYDLLGTYTHHIPVHLQKRLLACMTNKPVPLKEICSLNMVVGILFSDAAFGLMNTIPLPPSEVDCIGSHGQTLYHLPPPTQGLLGSTLQIGETSVIAERTGVTTIGDFRVRDMAVGGQGAPLVCLADQLLFQDETVGRCIQNIGGIANVTVLPPKRDGKDIIAFDTGPGNMLIDGAMAALFDRPMDENGDVAASGKVDEVLLSELMAHHYLDADPPKSTGREMFGAYFLQELLDRHRAMPKENLIATLTAFTARSIADAYRRFVFPGYPQISEVVLGGGGVYNRTLMRMLKDSLVDAGPSDLKLKTHEDFGVPDKYKEALAFAILAWATMQELPGNIPSCTGADRAVVLGKMVHC